MASRDSLESKPVESARLTEASDPRPRLALSIGVTGHRLGRLASDADRSVTRAIEQILRAIHAAMEAEQAGCRALVSDQPVLIRLVSPLAEGADTFAAQAALATGCELDVCLPFDRDEYARDFEAGPARERFFSLLRQACEVVELSGERENEDAAYESVGRATIALSDLVIAVWDGRGKTSRGGTAEILAEAVERGIPVIHVAADGLTEPSLIWSGLSPLPLERPTLWTAPRCPLEGCLQDVVRLLVAPPASAELLEYVEVRGKPAKRFLHGHLAWPLLLAATGVRRMRRSDITPEPPEAIAASHTLRLADEQGEFHQRLRHSLVGLLAEADALANQFGQAHRSGFVLNFMLAAFAVLLATAGILMQQSKSALVFAEILIILLIIWNTWRGRRGRWHERWLDLRHLAERSRVLLFMLPLGEQMLRLEADRGAGVINDWVRWRTRAAARTVGMPSLSVTPALVERMQARLLAMIDDQVSHHRGNVHRMHLLDHRLHVAGLSLFVATLLTCLLYLLNKFVTLGDADHLGAVVAVVTATLPAFGASFYAIRIQGDFAGIASRSKSMAQELQRLRQTIASDPPKYDLMIDRARRLASVMLKDLSDWRLTFEGRPLELPG